MALASAAGERHKAVEVPLLSVAAGVELFLGHFTDGEIDALSAISRATSQVRRLLTPCHLTCGVFYEANREYDG